MSYFVTAAIRRSLCALTLAATLAAQPSRVFAQSEQDLVVAKELGQAGLALFDRGEYEAALLKLDEAEAKVAIPPLGLYAGRALSRLGRLLEAEARFRKVIATPLPPNSPQVWQDAKIDAQTELDKLLPTIPKLEIVVVGVPDAFLRSVELKVDGVAIAIESRSELRLNPGPHEVAGAFADIKRGEGTELKLGEAKRVSLDFTPAKTADPAETSPLVIAGAVILSVGGAGLLTWGATGIVSMVKADEYKCVDALCPEPDVSDLMALRTTSTVSFYVGGGLALAGGGILLAGLLSSPSDDVALFPLVGPGNLGFVGRW